MTQPRITFREGVKASWKKELEIGDPLRILRLAFWTVWLSIYRVPTVLIPRAFWAVLKALGLAQEKR